MTDGGIIKNESQVTNADINNIARHTSTEKEHDGAAPIDENLAEKTITKKKQYQPKETPTSKIKINDPCDDSQFSAALKYLVIAAPTPNNHLQDGDHRTMVYGDFATIKTRDSKIVSYDPFFAISAHPWLFKVRPPPLG